MQAYAGAGDAPAEGYGAEAAVLEHMAAVFALDEVACALVEQLLASMLGTSQRRRLRLRTLLAPWLKRGQARAALAAVDPGSPLVRLGVITTYGSGPWLERRAALADDFWPRLLGHWPSDVPRARAAQTGLLGRLVLDPAARRSAERAGAGLRAGAAHVLVRGRAGSGRLALARAVSGSADLATIELRGAALTRESVRLLAREARWQRALLIIDGVEAVSGEALDELYAYGVRWVGTSGPGFAREPQSASPPPLLVEVPALTPALRATLWRSAFDAAGVDARTLDFSLLSSRFALGAGQIAETVRRLALAPMRVTQASTQAACRDFGVVEADGLARRLASEYTPTDLIVPTAVRRDLDLITTWGRRGAGLFANHRGLTSRGLVCLFHGPSGTGKTMAAQVVARELEIDLYRVDLAQLVDKYIGETEKRLDRLFNAAEASGSALLFDEADALFSRRADVKDARDRYANLETSYLLQRIEEHAGLCFLSSNLPHSIDGAFYRRFAFIVEFPRPALEERRAIWARLLELLAPERAPDVDLDFLADRFPLAGGDIHNAIFAALLLAARDDSPMSMCHLVIAGFRELVKSGRLVDGRSLAPWHDDILRYLEQPQVS